MRDLIPLDKKCYFFLTVFKNFIRLLKSSVKQVIFFHLSVIKIYETS